LPDKRDEVVSGPFRSSGRVLPRPAPDTARK
jgi:hypothetical protein